MTEFELIRTYFAAPSLRRADVRVGIGDDAAIVCPAPGTETVITTDVLVAGVHFFADVDPRSLGHKSLAVNLSDLAAVGAEPAWFLLNLTLPEANAAWLQGFSEGMFALAQRYRMQLVGGDTARGPLAIGITAIGLVPRGTGLLRSGARPDDAIYVTGALGDAALALALRHASHAFSAAECGALNERLERPLPRVAQGMALRDIASSAIDISDGLVADLGHVLAASGVGARIKLGRLPLSDVYRRHVQEVGWDHALAGGDDYELCFTVPPARAGALEALLQKAQVPFTPIGRIIPGSALEIYDAHGRLYKPAAKGYDHFPTV